MILIIVWNLRILELDRILVVLIFQEENPENKVSKVVNW